MPELSLTISPCPNDVFIFSGLLLGEVTAPGLTFRVDYQDVETCNGLSQRGEGDVLKISYANYPHCADTYDLLPCGGALGRGVGPLLLTNGGEFRPDREVLVPGEYTTAHFLLNFWARRELKKRFVVFDALYEHLLQTPGAQGVVIHEKRFTYQRDGLTLVQDLGEYWERETGYAIPLGAIIVRKGLPTDAIADAVRRSLRWAYDHYDQAFALCEQHAQDLNRDVIASHIKLYVNEYSEDLGETGREAVDFFLGRQKDFLSRLA